MSTVNWRNVANSDWSNPLGWDTGVVPAAGDDVVIPQSAAAGPYVRSNVGTVNSVTTQDTGTNFYGINLTGSGALAVTGNVSLSTYGYLDVDTGARDAGGSTLSAGGTISIPATFGNVGQIGLSIGGVQPGNALVTAGAIANQGTYNDGKQLGYLFVTGKGTGHSTLQVTGPAGFGTAGDLTGYVDLDGRNAALTFGSGQITSIDPIGVLTLADGIDTTTGFAALGGLASNAGAIILQSGASLTTSAAFTNTAGFFAGLSLSGGSKLVVPGTLTNLGPISLGANYDTAGSTVTANSLANTGSLTLTSGSSVAVKGAAGFGTPGVLTGSVTIYSGSVVFGSGAITSVAKGANLLLAGSGAVIADASDPTHSSALALTSNAGTLTTNNDTSFASPGDFSNTGTANFYDATRFTVAGTLTNSGAITYAGGDTAPVFSSARLVNTGTIVIDPGSSKTATAVTTTASVTNSGTVTVGGYPSGGAQLKAGGALANSGTMELDYDATVAGASFTQTAAGTLRFDGTPTAYSDSVAFAGPVALGGALQLSDNVSVGSTFTFLSSAPGQLNGIFGSVAQAYAAGSSASSADFGGNRTLGVSYNRLAGTVTGTIYATPASFTDNWLGGAGAFTDGAAWDNGAPTPLSDIVVGATVAGKVALAADATVDSLTLDNGGELDLTGGASLSLGTGANVQYGGVLDTSGSTGVLVTAGGVASYGTVTVNGGTVNGDFTSLGTLEVKSGTFTVAGSIIGSGQITVDAGATLRIGNTAVSQTVIDNGTIEVTNGAVDFTTNLTGKGSVLVDPGTTVEFAAGGPATIAFGGAGGPGVNGGTVQLDDPALVTGSFANITTGDTIDFAGVAATGVAFTAGQLQVGTATGTLSYGLASGQATTNSFVTYPDGYGGTYATLTSAPLGNYDGDGGTDNPPALGVVYDAAVAQMGQGVLTHNGTNWTLAFSAVGGAAAPPFHVVAVNRDGTDPIDATFTLKSGGGTGSDVTDLGDGATSRTGIKPGGYYLADGTPGYGPHLQVSTGTPTVYEVDTQTSNGATVFPAETLTILYGISPLGDGDGQIDPTNNSSSTTPVVKDDHPVIQPIPLPSGLGTPAHATGDVHLKTFDGVAYDLQLAGEFVLARADFGSDDFQVQIRTQPFGSSTTVTVTTQVAIQLGSDRVTLDNTRADHLMVDGQAVMLTAGSPLLTLAGGTVRLTSPNGYEVRSNRGEVVDLTVGHNNVDVNSLTLGLLYPAGDVVGLLGTDTGNPAKDFQTASGAILTAPVSTGELYGTFGNSWRITDGTSLFDYLPGQDTGTFQDTSFPPDVIQVTDLPQAVVTNASAAVDAAGITDPAVRAQTILDYALTDSPDFVSQGLTVQQTGGAAPYLLSPTPAQTTAPSGLGIVAASPVVTEPATGTTTPVTFTVYSLAAVGSDTTVNYAVLAAGAGYLSPADFGASPSSGVATVAAGQTSTTVTLNVPDSALGTLPSEMLRVGLSGSSGPAVVAGSADVTVSAPAATPGIAAAPAFVELTGAGILTGSGAAYTLDFGNVAQGSTVYAGLGIANTAAAGADTLGGSYSFGGTSGFLISGVGAFANIAAQGTQAGLNVVAYTTVPGVQTRTITLHPTEANASGFSGTLGDVTLTVEDDVLAAPGGTATLNATGLSQSDTLAENGSTPLFPAAPAITDTESATATAKLVLADPAAGTLADAGAEGAGGVYAISGTPAALSAALAAVTFAPATDFTGVTSVTVTVSDGQAGPQSTDPAGYVSLDVTEVNQAPVVVNQTLAAAAGVQTFTFAQLLAGDAPGPANEADQQLSITGVGSAVGGSVVLGQSGVTFTPSAGYAGPASFGYTVADNGTTNGAADPKSAAAQANLTVLAASGGGGTPAAAAPAIAGTVAGQSTTSEAPLAPFSAATVSDGNSGATEALTITVGGAGGTLTGAGAGSGGAYTLTGTAAAVTAALQAVVFTPAAGQPNMAGTSSFTLSDTSSAYGTAVTDGTTTVIDRDPAVAPTITGTVAGQATASEAAVTPFSAVTIGDRNAAASETLTITVGGSGGTLGGAGSGSGGVYTLTGTAAAVTAALQAVRFTPSAGSPGTSSTATFALSDMSSAYPIPATDTATTVVDSDPAGTTGNQVTISAPAPGAAVSVIDPVISGTAGVAGIGSTVTVLNGQAVLGRTVAGAGGAWSLHPTFAGDGSYTVTATDTFGGSTGTATDTFTINSAGNASLFGAVTHDATGAVGDVTALYEAILGRAPDPLGLEYWVSLEQSGASAATIAADILASPEYAAKTGPAAQGDNGFVSLLYLNGLHRQADPAGLQRWDTLLAGGTSRAVVAASIALSPESRNDLGSAFSAGVFLPSPADSVIARLYDGLLDRAPDATGLAYFERAVANGMTLQQVAQSFLNSPEYGALHSSLSDTAFVNSAYAGALGRAATDSGSSGWIAALGGGTPRAAVALGIVESQEAATHLSLGIESGFHLA